MFEVKPARGGRPHFSGGMGFYILVYRENPFQTFCTYKIYGYLYLFPQRANIGLVQFVLNDGQHVQALRLADEKIACQSRY